MSQLGLNNPPSPPKPPPVGYWKRQFQPQGNTKQKYYDWAFGVILPVVCFALDPLVFKGGIGNISMLANYKPFAYLLCFACIVGMMAWLIFGEKLKWLNGFLAGLFFLGGVISLGVGLVLLPFSFIGLLILIGALGFTPLFTAVIYLRNAFRALHASKMFLVKGARVYAFAFGIIFSGLLGWTINGEVKNSLSNIETGDAQSVYAEQTKLKLLAPLVNFDNLVLIYYRTAGNNGEKAQAIAEVYRSATGKNIEDSLAIFMD